MNELFKEVILCIKSTLCCLFSELKLLFIRNVDNRK